MSFDWQTEETTAWDDPVIEPAAAAKRPFRRWFGLGFVFLGLLLVALVAWAWQQRVGTVTAQVDGDVLASHAVLRDAAIRQDGELVISVLSGRDETWASQVAQLAADGYLFDRPDLALTWLRETAVITPTITPAPDFLSADVVWEEAYVIDVGHGLTETVWLAQTAVYRAGANNRWLLTPPDATFWGGERTLTGQHLMLTYPARDAAVVGRLMLNLDATLARMCTQLPDFTCPAGWQIPVYLVTSPAALATQGRADNEALRLPTPTLVGLPHDEAGYQALFRGYAAQIVAEASDEINPAANGALTQTLVQLGLRPAQP